MNQPQPHAHPYAAKDTRAQYADQKHRIGVIAEGQQPLGLLPGQQTVPVKSGGSLGTDGVAAHQPQQQGGTGTARQAEQRRHASGQVWGNPRAESQGNQQPGNHHEGEHGWNHRPGATGPRPAPPRCGSGPHPPETRPADRIKSGGCPFVPALFMFITRFQNYAVPAGGMPDGRRQV